MSTRFKTAKIIYLLFVCFFGIGPGWQIALADPTPISFGQTVIGSIDFQDETDEYTFSANAGDSILIAVSYASGSLYPDVSLYGPNGMELASKWSGYNRSPIEISQVLTESGEYTILVKDTAGHNTGEYGFMVERLNNPGNTIRMEFGETIFASIDQAGDLDLYTFSANAGDSILIAVSYASGSLFPDVSLYGPNGTELASKWSGYNRSPIEISQVLTESGEYTILVKDTAGHNTGEYDLFFNKEILEQLTLGVPYTGIISADIWHRYYVDVETDENLLVTLEPNLPTDVLELYGRYGQLPTKGHSDWTSKIKTTLGKYELLISPTSTGTYYFGIYGAGIKESIEYTITAELVSRHISDVYPRRVTNSTIVPIHILGLGFTDRMQVEIGNDTTAISANTVVLSSPQMMITQFDLSTTPIGEYDMSIIWPDGTGVNIENAIEIRPLPVGALYSLDLDMTTGEVIEVPIAVRESDNLFVTLQKSTLIGYGYSWSSTLKLNKDTEQIASASGSHDHILHITEPAPGAYTIELTAKQAGKGNLTVWYKLPELPMGQWVVGRIHCSSGSTWYQVEIPPEQDTFHLEAEAIGLWSHFDVFYEEYGGNVRWTSRQGPRVEFEIPDPAPGTYIVEFLDSAMIKGDSGWAIDQSRDVLIKANTTSTSEIPLAYLPVITGLSTDKGGNTGLVTVEIAGAWLDPNAIVSLIHADHDEIMAQAVAGDPNETTLTATFNLIGKESGQYTLNVINTDGHEIVSPTPFTIEEGGEPDLWVEIAAREMIRVGRWTTFNVIYGNSGTINANYPYVIVALPHSIEYEVEGDFARFVPGYDEDSVITDSDTLIVTALGFPTLVPNSTRQVSVKVRSDIMGYYTFTAAVTDDQAAVYRSVLAASQTLFNDLTLDRVDDAGYQRIQPMLLNDNGYTFPHKDMSDSPPADYLMFWSRDGVWHSAKSLGNGDFIEIMPDNDPANPDINIKNLKNNPYPDWDYWGSYRLPGELISEDELQKRVNTLKDKYGINPGDPHNKSHYMEDWCNALCEPGEQLRTFCWGIPFALNFDKINGEMKMVTPQQVYDRIKLPGEDTWYERMRKIGHAWDGPLMPLEWIQCGWPFRREIRKLFHSISSTTPEDKYGSAGFDPLETLVEERERFILAEREMYYKVDFWNKEDATAPAYDVLVEDRLDSNLDWNSFRFESVGFLKLNVELTPCQYFNVDIDMRPDDNWIVNVEGTFDSETGTAIWWFRTLDPVTRQTPEDPMAGFLPPITDSGEEIGWIGYTVCPQTGLTTGTQIANQAFVEFDHAGDLYDHPAPKEGPWINTIDAGAPESHVVSLPEISRGMPVEIEWTGQDDKGGSGIASYDIYVATDRGPFTKWLADTNETSASFSGEAGHTYAFYSVATDNTGNQEDIPSIPDATTSIKGVELVWQGQVSSSQDDGYAFKNEFQNLAFDVLKVGPSNFYPLPYYVSGMVFEDVNVPQGSQIVSVRLEICSHNEHLTDDVFGTITAEDSDNAVAFSIFSSVNDRPTTSASADWDLVEPWLPNTWYESPDIAEVIQEVINREGWSQGNSLALLYSTRTHDGGYRQFSSYDRGIDYAPKLEITYEP